MQIVGSIDKENKAEILLTAKIAIVENRVRYLAIKSLLKV